MMMFQVIKLLMTDLMKKINLKNSSNCDPNQFFSPKVLSAFEDVSLQSILNRIKEKHNLQAVKRVHLNHFDFI